MLNVFENTLVVLAAVGGSLLFQAAVNRVWPWEKRRVHNDLVGWQLSVLGTTYAVILGFMLYTVWTNYGLADLNVDAEANALVSVYRIAEGLPEQQRFELQHLSRLYADEVVTQDWPIMAADRIPHGSSKITIAMWRTLMSVKAASPTEITAEDHALSEVSGLAEHRRIRLLQSKSRLPPVLWCVLVVGGCLTIASACMFGSANALLHALQLSAFSLLVALVLIAIADIYRPFQGSVHVSDAAFTRAQENMRERGD